MCDSEVLNKNIWDDRILVDSYKKMAKGVGREAENALKKENMDLSDEEDSKPIFNHDGHEENLIDYKAGAYVRSLYEDGKDYEAVILSINDCKTKCMIKYIGYGNEEEVNLSELLPSNGESAREEQAKDFNSKSSTDVEVAPGPYTVDEAFAHIQQQNKLTNINFNDANSTCSTPQPPMPPMPPMPPALEILCEDDKNFSAMLMAWYMSGYHTGFYYGYKIAQERLKK